MTRSRWTSARQCRAESSSISDEKRSRQLKITVPPGVKAGQMIRLKGMGEGRGVQGDLYLRIGIRTALVEKGEGILFLKPLKVPENYPIRESATQVEGLMMPISFHLCTP